MRREVDVWIWLESCYEIHLCVCRGFTVSEIFAIVRLGKYCLISKLQTAR